MTYIKLFGLTSPLLFTAYQQQSTSTQAISPQATAYLNQVMDLLQRRSINRYKFDGEYFTGACSNLRKARKLLQILTLRSGLWSPSLETVTASSSRLL